jgi:hypothetical protein
MNRGDPPELGAWKITVEDTIEAKLKSIPELESGVVYSVTVKSEDSTYRTAIQEEAHQLVVIVGIFHEKSAQHP